MSAESAARDAALSFTWHVGNPDQPDTVSRLLDLAALRTAVDEQITEAIEQREAEGVTWQQVADALGVTRQAAHGRYRPGT